MKKMMLFAVMAVSCGSLWAFETQITFIAKTEEAEELKQAVTIKFFFQGLIFNNSLYKTVVLEPGKKVSVTLEEGSTYIVYAFNKEGRKELATQGDLVHSLVDVSPSRKASNTGMYNETILNTPTYNVAVGERKERGWFGTEKRIITFTSQDKITK